MSRSLPVLENLGEVFLSSYGGDGTFDRSPGPFFAPRPEGKAAPTRRNGPAAGQLPSWLFPGLKLREVAQAAGERARGERRASRANVISCGDGSGYASGASCGQPSGGP